MTKYCMHRQTPTINGAMSRIAVVFAVATLAVAMAAPVDLPFNAEVDFGVPPARERRATAWHYEGLF